MSSYREQIDTEIEELKEQRQILMEKVNAGGEEYKRDFFKIHSQLHSIDQSIQAKKDRLRYLNKPGGYIETMQIVTPINK